MRLHQRRLVTALALAGAAQLPAVTAQPANDRCADAIPITAGDHIGTTINATDDGPPASCSAVGPDVWYRYVAPFDGMLTLSTCGAANWDTILGVWNGCPSVGGTEVACLDDFCGVQTSLLAFIQVGTEYWIRVSGENGAAGAFTLSVTGGESGPARGPDVVYSDIMDAAHYGPVGEIHAYAFGTTACNMGDQNLRFGSDWGGSPSVGFNAYRLSDGRLLQIGQSWAKQAWYAASGPGCGTECNGVGGLFLGVGCRDVYHALYNGSHAVLARRSGINAFSGAHALTGGSGDEIFARLQISSGDLTTANALYFGEGVYVGSDDAQAGNALNNASHRRFTVSADFALSFAGTTAIGRAAIQAWREHGLGLGVPDPRVTIEPLDVPDEGRFIVAHKVRAVGSETWRYDYAIFNINSDRSGGTFSVPIPGDATITNLGFHDVPYHSGEAYDNTDWSVTVGADAITWSSPETFAQNPNSNALRWGTLYNFWFDANRPPAHDRVTLGLFKPHAPQAVSIAARTPTGFYPAGNLDGDGDVDIQDLALLLSDFGCTTLPCSGDLDADGDTDVSDLAILLANFGAGG